MSATEELRRLLDEHRAQIIELCELYKAENAKLRELARTLWGWLLMPTVGSATLHDLQGQLKELGIEVEQ